MFRLLKKVSAVVAIAALIFASPAVIAAAEGQIEGGDIYYARVNGGGFGDPVSANKGDTVQYRVRIHNPGPGALEGVTVKATDPSGSNKTNANSTVTVSAINANPSSTSDTATVNLTSASNVVYQPGSTELLDASGNKIGNSLPDTIFSGSGVSVGHVGVSIGEKRFVQFSVKIEGDTPPPPSVVCESLIGEYIGSTNVPAKIKFTAKGTASNGATISGYAFDFGDGAKEDSTAATIEHTYNKEGDYKATVQVKSSLGITDVSPSCSVAIKVTKDKPPVVVPPTTTSTPTTPSSLPSTGPVEVISGLLGTSGLGYGIRQWLASRKRLGSLLNQ